MNKQAFVSGMDAYFDSQDMMTKEAGLWGKVMSKLPKLFGGGKALSKVVPAATTAITKAGPKVTGDVASSVVKPGFWNSFKKYFHVPGESKGAKALRYGKMGIGALAAPVLFTGVDRLSRGDESIGAYKQGIDYGNQSNVGFFNTPVLKNATGFAKHLTPRNIGLGAGGLAAYKLYNDNEESKRRERRILRMMS